MENTDSITLAELAIYSKGQNKFEILWKTFERNSFCRYGCLALKRRNLPSPPLLDHLSSVITSSLLSCTKLG
jgi:hypothetical protein